MQTSSAAAAAAAAAPDDDTAVATIEEQPVVILTVSGDDDETANDGGDGGDDDDSSVQQQSTNLRTLRTVLGLMASPLTDETGSTKSVVPGLATIVLTGTCMGLAAAPNESLSPGYRRISAAIGYVYFMAWSVSFYPQLISNFKRKSTVGMSPDFAVLNVIGFTCYTAYNASFFWSSSIRDLYKERYGPNAEITVQSNDVAFAIHALVLSLLTLLQIPWYYLTSSNSSNNNNDNNNNNNNSVSTVKLSKPILLVILGIAVICTVYPLIVVLENHYLKHDEEYGMARLDWLDFLYMLSYIKIFISLIKYMPQVVLNFRRKSTVGWSILGILLDFTGGIGSDLQLILDCADLKDFSGITHNKAKLALGSLSIVFDLVFLVQHYFLYSGTRLSAAATAEQLEPLLSTPLRPPPPQMPPPLPPPDETSTDGDDKSSRAGPQTIFV